MDLHSTKENKRLCGLRRRKRAHLLHANMVTEKILENFVKTFKLSKSCKVSGYWPIGQEVNIIPLLNHLYYLGFTCCLPVVHKHNSGLLFREWIPGAKMQKDKCGILSPLPSFSVILPNLILTPIVAYDNAGNRLGYGAGYYDRTISDLRKNKKKDLIVVGVAYAAQCSDSLPRNAYDQSLDWVITEQRIQKF